MAFSSPPELDTLAALDEALHPLGYRISQQVRVLDAVRAAAADPKTTTVAGPRMLDCFLPAMRDVAGPFGKDHRWLRPGDWDYAFRSHFDFVVQEGLQSEHPTHPLFAVEFDGGWSHSDPAAQRRDQRKNRLCAASGLPLVRLDDASLHRRERFSVIEWLARLWAAYRSEMPRLIAERDAEVEAMPEEELAAAGSFLLGESPDLDVEFSFELEHPFPPIRRAAARMASRYGFQWWEVDAIAPDPDRPRWTVHSWRPPCPSLNPGLVERWTCELPLVGPQGQRDEITAVADVRRGYPLHDDEPDLSWDAFYTGQLGFLPAGPWTSAPDLLGKAMCLHNTLLKVENHIKRHDRR